VNWLDGAESFWKANRISASQEIPHILYNQKFHYRIHECPLSLFSARSIQSMSPSYFLNIHFNIILPPVPGSSMWSPSFSHHPPPPNAVYTYPIPHTCYLPRPYHSCRFDHANSIRWGVHIIKLLVMYFSPVLCYLAPNRPKYRRQHPLLKHPQLVFLYHWIFHYARP